MNRSKAFDPFAGPADGVHGRLEAVVFAAQVRLV